MAVYTPPTETLPIFDNSVFPSSLGTALTIATGQDYFLSYPIAQGSEIFPSNITLQSTLTDSSGDVGTLGQILSSTVTGTNWINPGGITGNLDLPPPYGLLTDTITQSASHVSASNINLYGTSTDSDILIGSTLPISHTLRLCNTSAGASGGSVHCSNIGFDGSNINNATAPAAGTIKIGNSLTSGPLYIGCGSSIATHLSGPIIIGSDSTASGGINIGTGTDLFTPIANTINIGSGTYTTNILGTLAALGITSASGGITATSGNITATGGSIIAPTLRNGANTGSISTSGVLTGTSVIAPSYNASANNIDVGICTNQTSGFLNIGTGARTIAGTINIGTGAGSVVNPINIGGEATTTTFANGLTLASSKYITTSHTGTITAPTASQVGYIQTATFSATGMQTSGNIKTVMSITLAAGVWILTGAITINPSQSITKGTLSFGNTSRTSGTTVPDPATDSAYGNTGFYPFVSGGDNTPNITVYVSPLTSTIFYLNVYVTYTGTPLYDTTYSNIKALRIA